MTIRRSVRIALLAIVMACGTAVVAGQGQTPPPARPAPEGFPKVNLTVGRSTILPSDFDLSTVTITDDKIADVTVIDPRQLLIDGKAAGTVSLILLGTARELKQYDVVVDPGVSALQRQLQVVFPTEDIKVNETPEAVILTGHASSNTVMLQAGDLAGAMAPKAKIFNMLQLAGGNGSQQVMLQVRIAEVNRRVLTELGTSMFTGATGYKDFIARGTTQQFSAPDFSNLKSTFEDGKLVESSGEITFSDFLNLFVFSTKYNLGVLIKALQSSGHFQSLAEPNLIAYNNQEASFLAGGELPIPVAQGTTGQVSIQYKEFGVKLKFTPVIAGDTIRLKVTPEVSSLDFANGITLGGFRVPALTTRKAQTDVELRDGQSFAIAGLMNNASQETKQSIPLLSRLPIVGHLFKSRATNQERTELLVLVTPHLVKPSNPDEVPPLPTLPGKFLLPCDKPPCEGLPAPKRGGGGGR